MRTRRGTGPALRRGAPALTAADRTSRPGAAGDGDRPAGRQPPLQVPAVSAVTAARARHGPSGRRYATNSCGQSATNSAPAPLELVAECIPHATPTTRMPHRRASCTSPTVSVTSTTSAGRGRRERPVLDVVRARSADRRVVGSARNRRDGPACRARRRRRTRGRSSGPRRWSRASGGGVHRVGRHDRQRVVPGQRLDDVGHPGDQLRGVALAQQRQEVRVARRVARSRRRRRSSQGGEEVPRNRSKNARRACRRQVELRSLPGTPPRTAPRDCTSVPSRSKTTARVVLGIGDIRPPGARHGPRSGLRELEEVHDLAVSGPSAPGPTSTAHQRVEARRCSASLPRELQVGRRAALHAVPACR